MTKQLLILPLHPKSTSEVATPHFSRMPIPQIVLFNHVQFSSLAVQLQKLQRNWPWRDHHLTNFQWIKMLLLAILKQYALSAHLMEGQPQSLRIIG